MTVKDRRTAEDSSILLLRVTVTKHGTNPDIFYPDIKYSLSAKRFYVYPVPGSFIDEEIYEAYMAGLQFGMKWALEANKVISETLGLEEMEPNG